MYRLAMCSTAEEGALSIPGSDQHQRECGAIQLRQRFRASERLNPSSEWYASAQKATVARSLVIFPLNISSWLRQELHWQSPLIFEGTS